MWADRDRRRQLTTHLADAQGQPWSRARDLHLGQCFQLIEDYDLAQEACQRKSDDGTVLHRPPAPFMAKAGEEIRVTVRFSKPDRHVFQVLVQRVPAG